MKSGNPGRFKFEFLSAFLWVFFQIYRLSHFSSCHSVSIRVSSHFCWSSESEYPSISHFLNWHKASTLCNPSTSCAVCEVIVRDPVFLHPVWTSKPRGTWFLWFCWSFLRFWCDQCLPRPVQRSLKPCRVSLQPCLCVLFGFLTSFPFWLCRENFSCFIMFYCFNYICKVCSSLF